MATRNLVLRTFYIDPDVDDELRNEAFAERTTKNDLIRKYLALGVQTARQKKMAVSGKTSVKKTAAKSTTKAAPKKEVANAGQNHATARRSSQSEH